MSGGSSAPMAYTPTNQAGQDQNYNALTGQLNSAGSNLLNTAQTGYGNLYNQAQANPYYGQAQTGANQVAQQGAGVSAQQAGGAAQMTGLAAGANGLATAGGYGLNYAPSVLTNGLTAANNSYGASQAGLGMVAGQDANLMGAGGQILNTAFDPQQALYAQQYQQLQDQTNSTSAMNGVAGSPYAAGIANTNNNNFNIDWQNAQLQRQIAGLGAYGTAATTADSNLNSVLGQQASDYNSLTSGATSNFGSLNNTADTGYTAAVGNAAEANNAASTLGNQSLQTLASSSALPDATYSANQSNILNYLNSLNSGINTALQPTTAGINAAGNYLSIGQNATSLQDQATAQNTQQQQAFWSGLTNLLGLGSGAGQTSGAGALSSMFALL